MTTRASTLSHQHLIAALVIAGALVMAVAVLTFSGWGPTSPGTPTAQSCAIVGTLLCLFPAAYFIVKRSGATLHPPKWFALHVLSVLVGSVMIAVHVANGDWVSAPGLILLALVLLIIQGSYAWLKLNYALSSLFGRHGHGFISDDPDSDQIRRAKLLKVINAKRDLLLKLDPSADEALFSPNFQHLRKKPVLSLRYQRLADREAQLVGARRRAGWWLSVWRRIHMLIAILFVIGVAIHVVVVIFFAGYVADGSTIDWWHITAFGRDWR